MELKVYNWEYFERGKTWYLIFVLFILLIFVLSVLSNNIVWWVFVLLISGGYLFYLTKVNKVVSMKIGEKGLQIKNANFLWDNLTGFVLEYHMNKKKIYNIVLIEESKTPRIYTINDDEKNVENFVKELNGYIPMLENYEQSTMDKIVRKLKL